MNKNLQKAATVAGVFVVAVILFLSWNNLFAPPPAAAGGGALPGIEIGDAPWAPEIANLRSRLNDIGLPALSQEGTVLHIHQHLDISINGNLVAVPAGIGIDDAAGFISPIHTHDTSGIIHVESNVVRTYTLGQFFDIWGVRFSANCIGGYCADAGHSLKVYANGALVSGDPRALALAAHQEIMIAYGSASSTPAIIGSYAFPAGY